MRALPRIPPGHALELLYLGEPVAFLEARGDALAITDLRARPLGLRAHIAALTAPRAPCRRAGRPRLRLVG